MADILADYREWRDAQPSHVGTHSDRCHMWHRDCLIHRLAAALAAEQAKHTLTDAEREAIAVCIEDIRFEDVQATLRGLLERTQKVTP
jgi:hypothetical protein